MSLQAEYVKEREEIDTLEFQSGFITFKFLPNECYIVDIYVRPDVRRSGYGRMMADEVKKRAKKQGYQVLTGSVDNRLKSSHISRDVLEKYGMKKLRDEGPMTYFYMEII